MSSCSQSTPRRSSRLSSSGYYDSEGKPCISYKENVFRYVQRRRGCSQSNKQSHTDVDSNTNHSSNSNNSKIDNNRQRNCRRGRNSNNRDRSSATIFNLKIFGFLFIALSLCFGFSYMFPTSSGEFLMTLCKAKCRDFVRQLVTPDADRMANFALESLGAKILLMRSSTTYCRKEDRKSFFGLPIWRPTEIPKTVIQGQPLTPGVCWPFAGDRGHLTIALSDPVTISHVTLSHVPKNLNPAGTAPSTPKQFSVYGLKTQDDKGTLLGTFVFDQDGDSMQTFRLPDLDKGVFRLVRLQIESNWGHNVYSCLYNFRVHGTIAN